MSRISKANDLKSTLEKHIREGFWGLHEREAYELEDYIENFSDREAYDIIKNYMVFTLNQVIEELEEAAEKKQEKAKVNRIQSVRNSIQSYKDSIAKLELELNELGV